MQVESFDTMNDELKLNGDEYSGHWNGMDFFNIQAGLDFRLLSMAGLGPYVSWSMGQYFNYSNSDPLHGKKSGSIAEKAIHEWLTLGIRLALKL